MSGQRVPGGVVHNNEFICWVEDAKQETTRERTGS